MALLLLRAAAALSLVGEAVKCWFDMEATRDGFGRPNLPATRDDRLRVAPPQGLAMLDLPRLVPTNRRTNVSLMEIGVGRTVQPPPANWLPPGTHHVELQFSAVELASDEGIVARFSPFKTDLPRKNVSSIGENACP